MPWLSALVLLSAADPESIRLVAPADPEIGAWLEPLVSALGERGVVVQIERVGTPSAETGDDAGGVEAQLIAAKDAYDALQPQAALEILGRAQTSLLSGAADPPALMRLARLLRLRGLTYLYLGKGQEAAQAFTSAFFLDPEHAVGADEWPPEARLAYADAAAGSRRVASGVLSVRLEPATAEVWLDGKSVGRGPRTLRDVPPGEHLLSARAPGHARTAAWITVPADGKLVEAPLFLERLAAEVARPEHLRSLIESAGRDDIESSGAALRALGLGLAFVALPGATHAVCLVRSSDRAACTREPAEPAADAAERLAERLHNPALSETTVPPAPGRDSFLVAHWPWLAGGGALLIAGGLTTWWLLSREPENHRVTFYIGRPP